MDLKATFDEVERGKLWKYLRGKGKRADVMDNIERIHRETKSKVKIDNGGGMKRERKEIGRVSLYQRIQKMENGKDGKIIAGKKEEIETKENC